MRMYDRGPGARHPASAALGVGCLYDLLALALPLVILATVAGSFALVWILLGDAHRAGLGAAGIAAYGGLAIVVLYVPYIAGFAASRLATPAWSRRTAAIVGLGLLSTSAAAGALALASGTAMEAAGIALLAATMALGGIAGTLAAALTNRANAAWAEPQ